MNSNLRLKNIILVPNRRQIQSFYFGQVVLNKLATRIRSDGYTFMVVKSRTTVASGKV